jgi:hypothetical protein
VDKYRKIQIGLLVVLIIAIGVFSYLMYSWNLAYSKGTFVSDDGTYTGEFKGKIFHGQGAFESELGVKYEGEWKDGKMDGFGIMTFANGSRYEGGFKDGLYNGTGKMIQADGKVIEGNWDNGNLKERQLQSQGN